MAASEAAAGAAAAAPAAATAAAARTPQETEQLIQQLRKAATDILTSRTGYDLIPDSGKVVVFDSRIPVKEAFIGLRENDIKGAPVWDSKARCFTGMLTVSDFIDILRHFLQQSRDGLSVAREMEKQTIRDWADIKRARGTSVPKLFYIAPEDSVFAGVRTMCQQRIHRLCVIEKARENSILCVLTLHRLARFLLAHLGDAPFMSLTLKELGIGTFGPHIKTISFSTPLTEALDLMHFNRISGLPIVEGGRAEDVYSRSDVRFLVLGEPLDIHRLTVGEALRRHTGERCVPFCYMSSSLDTALRLLITTTKHRLLIVEPESHKLVGILSLSDLFNFFVGGGHSAGDAVGDEAKAPA